ncbi:hypothetical protein [Paenibacillus gorillae]|uniref:hypothetical protein n=1 Tax=Paenibacillus gorillae TaxID=1243662 RepID=UPI0004B6AA33|nr:hypothetical protein [Paenibacillus gorillae]
MWAEIAAFLKANSTETLIISIVGTILVWMYKQFKSMIDREEQEKLKSIQLKQGLFTKLELSIASVLHLNSQESKQQMLALLGECGPHLTNMQRTVVRDYYKNFDPSLLYSLQALTVNEVDKLSKQLEKVTEDNGDWLVYAKRLYAPIWPLILFAIITMYVLFVGTLVMQGAGWWVKFNYLLFGVSIFISVTLAAGVIYWFLKREMANQGAKRLGAIGLAIFSSLIFLFNHLEFSIIVTIIQVVMIAFIARSKRPSSIIRL